MRALMYGVMVLAVACGKGEEKKKPEVVAVTAEDLVKSFDTPRRNEVIAERYASGVVVTGTAQSAKTDADGSTFLFLSVPGDEEAVMLKFVDRGEGVKKADIGQGDQVSAVCELVEGTVGTHVNLGRCTLQ
jgi:hypothetical protein